MPQIVGPSADTVARMVLLAIPTLPVAAVRLAYAVLQSPFVTGQDITVEQSIPFSHKHHIGDAGIDCRYCHTSATRSRFAGLPPTETCMSCHGTVKLPTVELAAAAAVG